MEIKSPEVIGINGWCDNEGIIINTEEEAMELPNYDKICVVSQTTNTINKFEKNNSCCQK